jgi:outer membrane protein TolC
VFAASTSLTLNELLTQVESSNPGLSAATEYNKALQNRIEPAGLPDDPFIAFGMDEIPYGEQSPQAYRYQISQSLPFPGKLSTREKIASLKAKAAEQETATRRREIKVISIQFFYRAFYNSHAIDLNLRLQSVVRSAMQSAKARYEAGGTEHHDWLLAKMELATLAVEQEKLKREQVWLHTSLNELRGYPVETPFHISAMDFPRVPEPIIDVDFNSQPELATLDAQVEQAASEYKLAKLSYYPDFVVQVMAMEPRNMGEMDNEKSNWGVMVGMNVPLYFGRKQSNLAAAARHEQKAAAMDKLYLNNKLKSELVNASQSLASAHDLVRVYETDVLPSTQLALENAQSAYRTQRIALSQYLALEKVHAIQRLELVAARIDVELAKTRLNELLSSPPLLRLAPSRPTVFGAGNMGDSMSVSDTVNMGGGMATPTNPGKKSLQTDQGGKSGMGGM